MEAQREITGATIPDAQSSIVGDRYLLQYRVRTGHLGDVYEATDLQLSKAGHGDHRIIIELYELRPDQAGVGERLASQFVQILSISHPNIVRAIDFGIDGSTVFFTTELLEGTSLRSVLDSSSTDSFTNNEVLGVLGSVTEALRHIHSRGLAHGALTPESIFITNNYEVKIADFASTLLKQCLDSSAAERSGISMLHRPVDDVFGLAAVAYEMLSNEQPFEGKSRWQSQRERLTLRRIKGLQRFRWKALSNALNPQSGKRAPTIDEFASQFGISGMESIRETETKNRKKSRRLLLPLILVVVAGLTAFFQFDNSDFRAQVSDFQERAGNQLNMILATAGLIAESFSTTTNVAIVEIQNPQSEVAPQIAHTPESQSVLANNADLDLSPDQTGTESGSVIQKQAALSALPVVLDDQVVVAEEKLIPALAASGYEVADTEPLSISFKQEFVTAHESSGLAAISIERQGAIGDEVSIIWWTAENSAMENQDYADFGVRTETLKAGQTSVTIYVPLVVDSHREPRESFYVYAGPAAAPKQDFGMLEVFVIDGRN